MISQREEVTQGETAGVPEEGFYVAKVIKE